MRGPQRRRGTSRSRASTGVANEPASQGVPQVQGVGDGDSLTVTRTASPWANQPTVTPPAHPALAKEAPATPRRGPPWPPTLPRVGPHGALLEEDDWESSKTHDLSRAVSLAKAWCGDNGHAYRMLRRVAAWTDEALADPRLWAATTALAERLRTTRTRLSASTAIRIMDRAWGKAKGRPLEEMGRKWQRRFLAREAELRAMARRRLRRDSP